MHASLLVWMGGLTRFLPDEEGQGLTEYAILLTLIVIVAVAALLFLGSQIAGLFSTVGTSV